ncbi:hypothetical protein AURDEDRAFT_163102 [Auricularia subglabra TFB-10046 SS5]|nr:hypothetical protein AURDEDRAFT_163102 [Auricularia subglabra TFB-10046 SS5]
MNFWGGWRAESEAPPDFTLRLPVELLSWLFRIDNLLQPDVLRAARVSHRWRATAITHRSYYAHISLCASQSVPWSADCDLRANYELHSSATNSAAVGKTTARCRKSLIPIAGHWLPVEEDDPVTGRVLPALHQRYSALLVSAPRLELLELSFGRFPEEDAEPLPHDLFAGHAPRLSRVSLGNTNLLPFPPAVSTPARVAQLSFIISLSLAHFVLQNKLTTEWFQKN